MTNDIFTSKNVINFFRIFPLICIGYTVLTVFAVFFVEDLFRILTPFFAPFFLLFVFFGYVALVIISIFYIPYQQITWRKFIPLVINLTAFLIVCYLYTLPGNLRVDIGFQVEEKRFNQVVQWVNKSIADGTLKLKTNREETIILPQEYSYLADRDRIYVTQTPDGISIFFSRGGGMFEYYPGFMYRSSNVSLPIEDGDIVCVRQIKPDWYDCY